MKNDVAPQPDRTVYWIKVPLRLSTSHNLARPGFQSARKGVFVGSGLTADSPPAAIQLTNLTIFDVPIQRLTMHAPHGEERLLEVLFDRLMSGADAASFLQKLADAWSATLAADQEDPWYGNLFVDVRWSGYEEVVPQTEMRASANLTSQQSTLVSREVLENLHWSPLTDVFVEGMKAGRAKSKFLFWFVILEELENREEFSKLFTPLFSDEEKSTIRAAVQEKRSAQAKQSALSRLDGLLNSRATTEEGRADKLLRILQSIGLGEVKTHDNTVIIDKAICASLIRQRNQVAQQGSKIDVNQLYTVLYPLSRLALAYITAKDFDSRKSI